jgi:hypothetical protein
MCVYVYVCVFVSACVCVCVCVCVFVPPDRRIVRRFVLVNTTQQTRDQVRASTHAAAGPNFLVVEESHHAHLQRDEEILVKANSRLNTRDSRQQIADRIQQTADSRK